MEKVKKILFLGGMFPKDSELIVKKSKGNIQNAANVFQWNVIKGLTENEKDYNFDLTVYSAPFVGSWPLRFDDLLVSNGSLEKGSVIEKYIPFLNISVYKNISRYIHTRKAIRKWLVENKDYDKYVIAYSAHTPFVKAIYRLKKKHSFGSHLIVPDLPQYMNMGKDNNLLYRMLKKVDIRLLRCSLKGIDSFTFLTEAMNSVFNLRKKPYTVVEGMVDPDERKQPELDDYDDIKTVVYTGGMEKAYGVVNLARAAEFFDHGIELILCGTGNADHEIEELQKDITNLRFKGLVSRKEALQYQANATVLINPRNNEGEFTKYSFPSKILEYMLWGKPIVTYKLAGIPAEYDDVLTYIEGDNPIDIAKKINMLCELHTKERERMGERIALFAKNKKNCKEQSKKIVNCLI